MEAILTPEEIRNYIKKVVRVVNLVRTVDGDTLRVDIDHGFHQRFETPIRFYRVDTPEKKGSERLAGLWVWKQVNDWIGDDDKLVIYSAVYNEDRYGRVLADVYKTNGECLNQWLLTQNYGWPCDEHGKIIGPRDINRLSIPEQIKKQVLIEQRN